MINPYSKRNIMSSSERIKKKAINNITKTIITRGDNYKSKNFYIHKKNIKRVINHEMLLKLTKGYMNLNKNCTNYTNETNQMVEGIYSYIDFCDLDHIKENPCCLDTYYMLNDCRKNKAIITPVSKVNPKTTERILKYPIPLKKVKECHEKERNNIKTVHIHKIGPNVGHTHYFPTNEKMVSYHNQHYDHKHPNPFPFPNYKSTNFMSKIEIGEYNKDKYKCKEEEEEDQHYYYKKCDKPRSKYYKQKIDKSCWDVKKVAQDYKIDKCKNDEKKLVSVVRNPSGALKDPVVRSKSPESPPKKSSWLERSKAQRKAQTGFENWGNIDHEDFNFDLDNDPYLDLIPEWRKEKLLERKNNKTAQHGYSGKYNVFNENPEENIKLNISN